MQRTRNRGTIGTSQRTNIFFGWRVVGAVVVANLPTLHAHFEVGLATKAGGVFLAVGVLGWASAAALWQLFIATLFSGAS